MVPGGQRSSGWVKSSASSSTNCLEVRRSGAHMMVRDSKNPDAGALAFTAPEWTAFLAGAKAGEFDWDRIADHE